VAEDERDLNQVIVKKLTAEGYSVDCCFNGVEALDYIECTEFDAVILDIQMPEMNGLEVVRTIRVNKNKTPVLFLTARDSISDRVKGLDIGADDYLVKPFSFEELLARIRVMTRRVSGGVTNIFTVADLSVDCNKRVVTRGDTVIALSAREFSVLEYMIRNHDIVLSRDKIEQHIWNYDFDGDSNVIDVYIRYLRKKIDDDFDNKLIHTVRGAGYVLREDK
jgi:DNA-binding response OmpR family regulator